MRTNLARGRVMSSVRLGRTLVLANPTAHSGRGEGAALFVTRFFSSFQSAATSCEVRLTEAAGDAQRMASESSEYDVVIALGGDGIIHEVVNGLMGIPDQDRPVLGVIPMGTGNDFARTLGVSINDPERSVSELLRGRERAIDLGKVNDTYFVQTLSFGLDAAIALDTTDRRARNSSLAGALLFVTSGLRLIVTNLRGWPYEAIVDGEAIGGTDVVLAVQNGPTYGGGFRICPQASPNDGMLDLCYTVARPSVPHSLLLFGLARFGRHARSRKLSLRKACQIEIAFPSVEQPPCQVDGESLEVAERYKVRVVTKALRVIVPENCPW